MLAVDHCLRKCLCDDVFCSSFSKSIICFPFFKHFVSSNNNIFKTVDGQWTIPLRKLFSCIFFGAFFLERCWTGFWNSLLGGFKQTKVSILVTKFFLFHSQHSCSLTKPTKSNLGETQNWHFESQGKFKHMSNFKVLFGFYTRMKLLRVLSNWQEWPAHDLCCFFFRFVCL